MQLRARRVPSLLVPPGFRVLRQAAGGPAILWKRTRYCQSVLWEGAALMRVGRDGAIRITSISPLSSVLDQVLNMAVALLLARRGYRVLHGGALARNGLCLVVTGPPGAGKSSLVLAGARRGLEVISDEIVPLRRRGTVFECPGGNPRIRIDPALLRQRRAEGAERKVGVDVRRLGYRHRAGPSRVAAFIFLGRRLGPAQPRFRLEALPPSQALVLLLQSTYNRRVQTEPERVAHFRDCAAAARLLPAWRLSVRAGLENVAAAARALDGLLDRLSAGHRAAVAQAPGGRRSGVYGAEPGSSETPSISIHAWASTGAAVRSTPITRRAGYPRLRRSPSAASDTSRQLPRNGDRS